MSRFNSSLYWNIPVDADLDHIYGSHRETEEFDVSLFMYDETEIRETVEAENDEHAVDLICENHKIDSTDIAEIIYH